MRNAAAGGGLALLTLLLAGCGGSGTTAATNNSSPAASAGAPAPALKLAMRHIDRDAGFQIDFPESWKPEAPSDPKVQFLAGPKQEDASNHDFAQVRVVAPLPATFGPGDLQAMKKISDALLSSQTVSIAQEEQVTLAGLPAYEYIYTFKDGATGQVVAHVHEFIFSGNRLISLVFQAQPESTLRGLLATFLAMRDSFKVIPVATANPTAKP